MRWLLEGWQYIILGICIGDIAMFLIFALFNKSDDEKYLEGRRDGYTDGYKAGMAMAEEMYEEENNN